jgi:hypothetical protein
MISRREVVTAGMLGTLAASGSAGAEPAQEQEVVAQQIKGLQAEIANLSKTIEKALLGPSLSAGMIVDIREKLTKHLGSHGKFPDLLEVGINPFMEVYDWHVRHQQQIQITRVTERFAIQFMFTQLIMRWDMDRNYIGTPYDRG